MFSWWSPTKARANIKSFLVENTDLKQSLKYKIARSKVIDKYAEKGISESEIPQSIMQKEMEELLKNNTEKIETEINSIIDKVCNDAIPKYVDFWLKGIKFVTNFGVLSVIFIPALQVLLSIDLQKQEWSGLDIGLYWLSIGGLTLIFAVSLLFFYQDFKNK